MPLSVCSPSFFVTGANIREVVDVLQKFPDFFTHIEVKFCAEVSLLGFCCETSKF